MTGIQNIPEAVAFVAEFSVEGGMRCKLAAAPACCSRMHVSALSCCSSVKGSFTPACQRARCRTQQSRGRGQSWRAAGSPHAALARSPPRQHARWLRAPSLPPHAPAGHANQQQFVMQHMHLRAARPAAINAAESPGYRMTSGCNAAVECTDFSAPPCTTLVEGQRMAERACTEDLNLQA